MSDYNIYAGLNGGFGGAEYQGTLKDVSMLEAEERAYDEAVMIYESYDGLHGLKTWYDCFEEFYEEKGIEASEENIDRYLNEIDELYNDEIDSWIEYYIVNKEEDEDFDEEDYYEI